MQYFQNSGFTNISTCEKITTSCIDVVKFSYDWEIQFNDKIHTQEVLSPEFPNRTNSTITWCLLLEPLASYIEDYGINMYFTLRLKLVSCNVKYLMADYVFKMEDDENHSTGSWKFMLDDADNTSSPRSFETYFSNYLLRLHCDITIHDYQVPPVQVRYLPKELPDPQFTFAEELKSLFKTEEFSDITFSVDGKELKLHKAILASRCPVFKAMFEHEMSEKIHSRVEITDIEFDVLRELMSYIYTDNVSNLEQCAEKLLVAADKYSLEKLIVNCEIVLCKQLSTDNVAEMFIFADKFSLSTLKLKAKNFINDNAKDVSSTPGWKSLVFSHPQLLEEVFLAVAIK